MLRLLTIFILCCLCALMSIAAAKPLSILITAFPAAGHITPAANLGEELVRRGHAVSLCTMDTEGSSLPMKKAEAAGMKYLSAGKTIFTVAQMQDVVASGGLENKSVSSVYTAMREGFKVLHWFPDVSNAIGKFLDHQNFTDYDIVISTEFLTQVTACLSKKWNVPAIVLSTTLQFQGEHLPPWPFPPHYMNKRGSLYISDNLSFLQRLLAELYKPIYYVAIDLMLARNVVSNLEIECANASYSFLKYFPGTNAPQIIPTVIGLEYPRLISSLTHYVGPILSKQTQEIPDDLKEWLATKRESSVVMISMGSLAPLTPERGKIIVKSVMTTNYSVIWSLRDRNRFILDGLEIDKDRFYISKWIPQAALLKHPATAMALLHGGMNGIHEAIAYGVPIIVMPFASDQGDVSARVENSGAGIQILKEYLSVETLTAAIRAIQHGKFKAKVSLLQRVSQEAGGVNRAADLVEHYADVGYEHLVPAYAKYNWSWVQYYNIDVCAAIFLTLALLSYIVVKLCQCVCRRCCCGILAKVTGKSKSKSKPKED